MHNQKKAEEIEAWASSPAGQAAIENAFREARETVEMLNKARCISPEQLRRRDCIINCVRDNKIY